MKAVLLLAATCLSLLAPRSFAQNAMASDEERLNIGVGACLRIAKDSLSDAGYRLGNSGTYYVYGKRDLYHAIVICSEAPERQTYVHIVISSEGRAVPDEERIVIRRNILRNAR